jgi:hypothetical protein
VELSAVVCFVCESSSSRRRCGSRFSQLAFQFGKAKSAMLKIVSSDASRSATQAQNFCEQSIRPFFAKTHELSVKK